MKTLLEILPQEWPIVLYAILLAMISGYLLADLQSKRRRTLWSPEPPATRRGSLLFEGIAILLITTLSVSLIFGLLQ